MARSLLVMLLGGAAFSYVAACARICALESERTRLLAAGEGRINEIASLKLQRDRLYESDQVRASLQQQGYGPAAGRDWVALVAPQRTPTVVAARPQSEPPSKTRQLLRTVSTRAGTAVGSLTHGPAEVSRVAVAYAPAP